MIIEIPKNKYLKPGTGDMIIEKQKLRNYQNPERVTLLAYLITGDFSRNIYKYVALKSKRV